MEADLMRKIQLKLAEAGVRLFRNNVGMGWIGQVIRPGKSMNVRIGPQDVILRDARPLHAGLCKGSGDLIGLFTITITPEMVGSRVAVFSNAEIKLPGGRVSAEQKRFNSVVNGAGGLGVVAYSVDEAVQLFSEWKPRKF